MCEMKNMKIDVERWYSEREVAEIYGISPKALNRRLNSGRMRIRFSEAGSRRLFHGSAIVEDLAAAEHNTTAKQPGVR